MTATMPPLSPLSAGAPAPDFSLPAIDGTGTISLADYRGKAPVLLALFVGLWCPFCRRSIAQMSAIEPALKEDNCGPVYRYPVGSWGPQQADRILPDGDHWFPPS